MTKPTLEAIELAPNKFCESYDFFEEHCIEDMSKEFWDYLSFPNRYFEPCDFDEAIAIECGLTPFKHDDMMLLASCGTATDLFSKLDAYQVLTHRTIDRESTFFTDKEQFTSIVGKDIVDSMEKILYEDQSIIIH